jgi:hypothetical protein
MANKPPPPFILPENTAGETAPNSKGVDFRGGVISYVIISALCDTKFLATFPYFI